MINYVSHVHLNYHFVRLYSTRLKMQYKITQLRHSTTIFREVRHNEKSKQSTFVELRELPYKMHKCDEMLAELINELDKLMEIFLGDLEC